MKITKNFSLYEFRCRDKQQTAVPEELIANTVELAYNLQHLRDCLEEPISINSSYRTLEHNDSVGGSITSQHLVAKAADVVVKNLEPIDVAETIKFLIRNGIMKEGGVGIYDTFVHYDIRGTKARWDYRTKN